MQYAAANPKIKYLIGIVGVIVLFFLFCFRVIGVGEVGMVTRFGKVVREAPSGVVIKLPWPIEHVTKLNIQVQKEQVDATASTSDLQDVTTTLALNYHLDPLNAKEVFTDIGTEYKIRVVDPAIQEAFKATSANFTATELLNKRPEVKEHALEVIKSRLEHRHIIVDDLSIVNFKFSSDFTQSIENKQVAQQNAEKAQFELEKAQLDAQAQEAQKASLSPELLQKYAIDKWDGKMPTYVGGGSVFNIPLGN
jgi:regulator of protease activity HflC (stomatin/prohibitin superfamily)